MHLELQKCAVYGATVGFVKLNQEHQQWEQRTLEESPWTEKTIRNQKRLEPNEFEGGWVGVIIFRPSKSWTEWVQLHAVKP